MGGSLFLFGVVVWGCYNRGGDESWVGNCIGAGVVKRSWSVFVRHVLPKGIPFWILPFAGMFIVLLLLRDAVAQCACGWLNWALPLLLSLSLLIVMLAVLVGDKVAVANRLFGAAILVFIGLGVVAINNWSDRGFWDDFGFFVILCAPCVVFPPFIGAFMLSEAWWDLTADNQADNAGEQSLSPGDLFDGI